MKYRVSLVKAVGIPGPSKNSPPAECKVLLREVELLFLPYPTMDYVYCTEDFVFEETIDSVAYIESECRFEARLGYTECKNREELQKMFDAHTSSGWREVLPPEEEGDSVVEVEDTFDDILPKDLDEHLRGLQ